MARRCFESWKSNAWLPSNRRTNAEACYTGRHRTASEPERLSRLSSRASPGRVPVSSWVQTAGGRSRRCPPRSRRSTAGSRKLHPRHSGFASKRTGRYGNGCPGHLSTAASEIRRFLGGGGNQKTFELEANIRKSEPTTRSKRNRILHSGV